MSAVVFLLRLVMCSVTGVLLYNIFQWGPWILFSNHPAFMILATLFMIEGTISITNPIFKSVDRIKNINNHYNYQGLSAVCWTIAFTAIYMNKNRGGKQHFTSNHGIIGVLAFALAALQSLFGSGLKYKLLGSNHRMIRRFHYLLNFMVMILFCLAIVFAMWSNWAVGVLPEILRYGIVVAMFLIFILYCQLVLSMK